MSFFSIWVFFHEYSRFRGQHGNGEGIYLTPHYHFDPLHRHLDISRTITADSSLRCVSYVISLKFLSKTLPKCFMVKMQQARKRPVKAELITCAERFLKVLVSHKKCVYKLVFLYNNQ